MQHWKSAHRRALLRPILADGGSPPLRGSCCFTVRYLSTRGITTNLTLRPPLFTLRPPLSHTPLSHTTLTHHSHTLLTHDALTHHPQTHCSHTRTTALTLRPPALLSLEEMARRLCLQHVSREPGTRNPLSHKGLRGNRWAGLRPTIKGIERGEGLPKRRQMSVGCRRRKAVPTAQAHHQTRPCKDTGSQSKQIVETASETTTTRNEHVF